jgi:hypothetical protein
LRFVRRLPFHPLRENGIITREVPGQEFFMTMVEAAMISAYILNAHFWLQ